MARWQFSASAVTIVPFNDNSLRRLGTAVISLDLASVAIWASTMRCSHPHALTMCRADLPLARSNERRKTLPSIAITPWHSYTVKRIRSAIRLAEQGITVESIRRIAIIMSLPRPDIGSPCQKASPN